MARAITVIPATKDKFTALPTASIAKRRVAAYARVSTDSDEQFTSYEAQIDYYTQYIKKRDDWEFVKVYTDEGISGTNTKRREGFNEMVSDALAGKIDLIVTKSVSRFARNTVDSLVTVRKLKEHHVEVFFEKENIYTFDSKGELLITIMSSLAPEVVRMIYRLFLEGKTAAGICKHLMSLGIPTPGGKIKWVQGTVMSILQNEKYKGDALLQKKFTVDFLTKKQKVNEGEVPQYYVEGSHPAIITALDFDRVQAEIARRKSLGRSYSGSSIFASKLICGDCGGFYGKKVWHPNDAYRREVWRCNSKFKGEARCEAPALDTEVIQRMFLKAYNQLMGSREQIIQACEVIRSVVADFTELDAEIEALNEEIQVVAGLVSQCIKENATSQQSQEEYNKKYNRLVKRYEKAVNRLKKANAEKESRTDRDRDIRIFTAEIEKQPLVLETWDERLWISLLDSATVHADGRITFRFKDGTEIEIQA